MKKLALIIIMICNFSISNYAQDISFYYTVFYPTPTTARAEVFAQKNSGGTENMAGYTINIYYDNTEATLTDFDTSPATSLAWDVSSSQNLLISNDNNSVSSPHTGFGTINVIDQNLMGTEVSTTPVHILTITFDNTIGIPRIGGKGFLVGTGNNHPAQEYVGNDFIGHDVVITGTQDQLLNGDALPVELISFQAKPTARKTVDLIWQTATELNNDYFTIEKSTDGTLFESIEIVTGAGSSNSVNTYQTSDQHPYMGINYYRLKQTDYDGSFEYSDIQVVVFEKENRKILIYPNPTSGAITLKEVISGDVIIRNITGQVVWQKVEEHNLQHLDLSHLSAGTYFLEQLDQKGNLNTAKFIISKN